MTALDLKRMNAVLDAAAKEGRSALLEHEVYEFLSAAGCRTPRHFIVAPGQAVDAAQLAALGGERVMLKIVSTEIAHKTDVGGVKKCAGDPKSVAEGIARMLAEVPASMVRDIEARPGHRPEAYQGLAGKALEDANPQGPARGDGPSRWSRSRARAPAARRSSRCATTASSAR
jgi:hypothetical protein